MIDFPASPVVGQQFISGGTAWTWDGQKWVASGVAVMPPLSTGDNRVINGDMRIDQRNNGAAGTAIGYAVDRWQYIATQASKGTWQRVTGPTTQGFPYSFLFNSTSAYAVAAGDTFYFTQAVEADMVSDFAWGSASAQPMTLSFWIACSLTGTFSGSIANPPTTNRSYPFTFSIPTANTWTKIVVTIPGDTGGAWTLSGNGVGLYLRFDLGSGATFRAAAGAWTNGNYVGATGAVSVVGTNGAVFNLTGVKLEIGSVATPYNRQSLAKSLADCQRYFETGYPTGTAPGATSTNSSLYFFVTGLSSGTNWGAGALSFNVTKRAQPTLTLYSPVTGASGKIRDLVANADLAGNVRDINAGGFTWNGQLITAGANVQLGGQWTASAEL